MIAHLSRPALLLLKLDLLRRARSGILAKMLGRKLFSLETAVIFKAVMALLFVGVTCLLPLLTLSDFGEGTQPGRDIVRYHDFIMYGMVMFLFFSGLFVGAISIYELALSENEQLLGYPVVLSDLVQYRVMAVLLVVVNACLYFYLPIMVMVFLALGWSAFWIGAMAILTTLVLVAVFLLGISVFLFIARLMPQRGSDKIFIGLFLTSLALMLIAVQLYKGGYFGPGDISFGKWLGQHLSQGSLSLIMNRTILRAGGGGQYALSLVVAAMLVFSMVKLCARSFGRAFHRLHIQADDMTVAVKPKRVYPSYAGLNRYLGFLPLDLRTLLAKDILALVRGPNLLVKVVGFLVVLVVVANWRWHPSVADPFLFVLYASSTFIISRFFIDIVGQERNNIFIIKQLYPSVARYFWVRARITGGISLVVLLPIWVLLVGTNIDMTWLEAGRRLPLLLMTVVLTSALVTCYSAAFAEFSKDHIEKYKFCIHPAAIFFFWSFSGLVTLFFYKLDLALFSRQVDNLAIILIGVIGFVLTLSLVVFGYLGIRRIKHCV